MPNGCVSTIKSRTECDTSLKLFSNRHNKIISIDMPIYLSPMSFYGEFAFKKIKNRMIYMMPRMKSHLLSDREHVEWGDINVRIKYAEQFAQESTIFGVSVGLKDNIEDVVKLARFTDIILLDVANGYSESVHQYIKKLKTELDKNKLKTYIMSGNVIDNFGAQSLTDAGSDLIRVGIGGGSLCTTAFSTAVSRPMLSLAMDLSNYFINQAILDGGIKNSASLSLGLLFAKQVMISGLFKFTELNDHYQETERKEGKVLSYGMASAHSKNNMNFVEGKAEWGEPQHYAAVYAQLKEGLQSSMSYLGAKNLQEYRNSKYDLVYSDNYL